MNLSASAFPGKTKENTMDETLELLKKLMACEAISEKVENVNAAMEVMAEYLRSKNVC